jgi:hypothetical protein
MTNTNLDKTMDTLLARFFTEPTVRALIEDDKAQLGLLKEFYYLVQKNNIPYNGKTYGDLYEFAYSRLLKNYRNEYIYKNAIANKILLGKHSLNTSFMLQEFRVGNCKADTLILNGTSNIYEIKSEFDSLDRLSNQVHTYLQAFDMVHVITSPGQSEKIKNVVPKNVGLMELGRRNQISTIREAKSGKKYISTSVLFDSLRSNEYQSIIKEHFGYIPDVPNTRRYSECKNLFVKIKPDIAHDLMVEELKKRGNKVALKDFVSSVPEYFRSLSLSAKFSRKDAEKVCALLSQKVHSFH